MRFLRTPGSRLGIAHAPEVPFRASRPRGQLVVLARGSVLNISRPIADYEQFVRAAA